LSSQQRREGDNLIKYCKYFIRIKEQHFVLRGHQKPKNQLILDIYEQLSNESKSLFVLHFFRYLYDFISVWKMRYKEHSMRYIFIISKQLKNRQYSLILF